MGNRNSGRRPIPTALKLLRGNPGQRKLNPDEPKAIDGPVNRPGNLSGPAVVVWERMAPVCLAMRTLTAGDVDTFATLCELQADMDRARAAKDTPDEKLGVLEAIALEVRLAPIIRPFYGLFGMDPSSRTKIHVPKQTDEPQSKWAGVLK